MRARDVRAITFCVMSSVVLLAAALLLTKSFLVSVALTAGYDAWLLTRPRMIRVLRRLRGEPDWSGYFDNDGSRLSATPGPAATRSSPRPAERR